jgi:hypothetical protein
VLTYLEKNRVNLFHDIILYLLSSYFYLYTLFFQTMGILRRGILGGFSGKVANVVGSSWKGIAVMKSLPLSVANPRTAGQVAQRNRFSNTVAFAVAILGTVIKPLWDRFAQQQSGFNAFISENIELFDDESPSPPADLIISKGRMASTPIDAVATSGGGQDIQISWNDDTGSGFKLATDIPYVVVANLTTDEVLGYEVSNRDREDESVTVAVPGNRGTDTFAVYLAFRRADGTVVSNTAYSAFTA